MSRLFEIAAGLDAAGTGWGLVLVGSRLDARRIRDELVAILADLRDQPAPAEALELEDAAAFRRSWAQRGDGVLVASVGESFRSESWETLELAREELRASGRRLVLVLDEAQARAMGAAAPNLLSVFGAGVERLEAERTLTPAQREERLAALRSRFSLSDQELIDRWTEGTIAPDPDIAEWLVLLGRGDLLQSPAA